MGVKSKITHWYPLDETSGTTATDAVAGGTNGTYIGTPSLNQSALFANQTNSVSFNGSSQRVDIVKSILAFGTNTISVVIYFNAQSDGTFCLFGIQQSGSAGLSIDYNLNVGGKIAFTKIGVSGGQISYTWTSDSNNHCLVCVANSSGMYMYLDNSQVATGANTSNFLSPSTTDVSIAARNISPIDAYLAGKVSNVGVSNQGFTTDDVAELWNSGNGVTYATLAGENTDVAIIIGGGL